MFFYDVKFNHNVLVLSGTHSTNHSTSASLSDHNRSTNMTRSTVAVAMPQKKGAVETNTAQEDGQSPVKWEKSDGKKFLRKELWKLDSAFQSISIRDIHSSDPCFSEYPLKYFTTNFKNLKKKVNGLRVQVNFDEQAVSQH